MAVSGGFNEFEDVNGSELVSPSSGKSSVVELVDELDADRRKNRLCLIKAVEG